MMAMVCVRVVNTGVPLLFTRFIPKLSMDDRFLQHGTYQGTENRGGSFPPQSRFTRGSALHPVGTISIVVMGSQAFVSLRGAASSYVGELENSGSVSIEQPSVGPAMVPE